MNNCPVTLLTVAWWQEPSHRIVLREPPDIGSANVEYQAVERGPGGCNWIV